MPPKAACRCVVRPCHHDRLLAEKEEARRRPIVVDRSADAPRPRVVQDASALGRREAREANAAREVGGS